VIQAYVGANVLAYIKHIKHKMYASIKACASKPKSYYIAELVQTNNSICVCDMNNNTHDWRTI
jgi:hypothetical protein